MPSFTLRLPSDLRDKLVREAFAHKRSLGSECVIRLEASFKVLPALPSALDKPNRDGVQFRSTAAPPAVATEVPPSPYMPGITKLQQDLLDRFAALSGEQQLALLTLLRR